MHHVIGRIIPAILVMLVSCSNPNESEWMTYFEITNGRETPRYDETIRFIEKLSNYSDHVHMTYFGVSPQGRKLPLVIVDGDGQWSPGKVREAGKTVVLIQACIHAGEPDGKDAGLMLIRDMVVHKKHTELLEHITLLFMPIFNVDGHERFGPHNRINQNGPKEMGWRTTSQNLNLNRDYMKADAPEMRSWLKVFGEWLPDMFIDCHVTDGADYEYVVTYAMDQSLNAAKPLRDWTNNVFLPQWTKRMDNAGYPVFFYVSPKYWSNFTKGLNGGIAPPKLSTGYGVVQNRPSLLIETHMFKDYRTRVYGTYQAILQTLQVINVERKELAEVISKSDEITANPGKEFVPLSFSLTDKKDTVHLKGFSYHLKYSSISDDSVIIWEKTPKNHALPFYNENVITDSAQIPYAFIIPQQWISVLDVLRAHDIKMRAFSKDITLDVSSYRFEKISWENRSYEGRCRINFQSIPVIEKRNYKKGDFYILMNQRLNKVILHLLEPNGPDSFLRWGFFNAVFEQKEYAENYMMELLATKIIADDPGLRDEFLNALKKDTLLANDSYARYNWFFKRTPYWDRQLNVYPIGKIMNPVDLK